MLRRPLLEGCCRFCDHHPAGMIPHSPTCPHSLGKENSPEFKAAEAEYELGYEDYKKPVDERQASTHPSNTLGFEMAEYDEQNESAR